MTVRILFRVECDKCSDVMCSDGSEARYADDDIVERGSHLEAREASLEYGWLTRLPATQSGFRPDGPTLCPTCREKF